MQDLLLGKEKVSLFRGVFPERACTVQNKQATPDQCVKMKMFSFCLTFSCLFIKASDLAFCIASFRSVLGRELSSCEQTGSEGERNLKVKHVIQ